MSRQIVTVPETKGALPALQNDKKVVDTEKPDTYRDRLYKYIPAEVITLYMTLTATLRAAGKESSWLGWATLIVGMIGTWFYLRTFQKVTKPNQILVSVASFTVWVFALGGPFAGTSWYSPIYGAWLLPAFTFFIARFPRDSEK